MGNNDEQRLAFTHYLRHLDRYDNLIKAHEIEVVDIFTAMKNNPAFDGASLQLMKIITLSSVNKC